MADPKINAQPTPKTDPKQTAAIKPWLIGAGLVSVAVLIFMIFRTKAVAPAK